MGLNSNREPVKATIDGVNYYIQPFSAIKAANISGELLGFASPLVLSILSLVNASSGSDDDMGDEEKSESILDMDISEAAPTIIQAFSSIKGDNIERLLKILLFKGNIAFDTDEDRRVEKLDEANADALFVGEIQNMYLLAWEVIKANFGGFFKKISAQFGGQDKVADIVEKLKNTANSTLRDSETSN